MRYLPTIEVWAPGIQEAIMCNQLKLQVGQWISCGGGQPSRYVKHTRHSIWAAHPEGKKGTRDSFKRLLKASGAKKPPKPCTT